MHLTGGMLRQVRPLAGNPLIDEILAEHREGWSRGDANGWLGYRNHAQRVFLFAQRFRDPDDADHESDQKLAIAAAFHDLAVFTTVDYLTANLGAADHWLTVRGLDEWRREIGLAMTLHHRVRPYRGEAAALVEPIRRADWVECTAGVIASGLPRAFVRQAQKQFPTGRFAVRSTVRIATHAVTHPTNPLPFWRSQPALEQLPPARRGGVVLTRSETTR